MNGILSRIAGMRPKVLYTEDGSEQGAMPASAEQITHRNILRVLLVGFALVILLLLAAGFIGVKNIQSIQENAATLVEEQDETSDLIDEVQRERMTLSAVFYDLVENPEAVDREKMLSQLKAVSENVKEIASEAEDTPEAALARELRQATEGFSAEARRVLASDKVPTRLSRDLLRRHQQVVSIVGRLIASNEQKARAAQQMIDQQSQKLMTQSFVLLGTSLLLALLCAVLTVKMTADLFRKMQWQTSELSRVSWHMVQDQETIARRFSHELHDELGQSLTALKANLVSLRGPDAPDRRLEDCVQLVDGAIQNVRELSQLLRPIILDDFGLDASLRWLSDRFTQRTGIETDYKSNFSGRLPDETETHLFRIAQEALTNVARHSGATRVSMDLQAGDDHIRLSISDNGTGLRDGAGGGEKGLGMIGMRARARSAGGELNLRSTPGQGVSIEVKAPVKAASHEQKDPHSLSR
jgi:signal transduction histidine kinase